jgi:hypothetical protein
MECRVELEPDGCLRLSFVLSSGTYATALLREIASEVEDAGGAEESGGQELAEGSESTPSTQETQPESVE